MGGYLAETRDLFCLLLLPMPSKNSRKMLKKFRFVFSIFDALHNPLKTHDRNECEEESGVDSKKFLSKSFFSLIFKIR